ncbi:dipeptidase [Aureimonas jatrophae]|uniref:Acetylornithine deacetylase/Succinyl-diaminopimelate desuccinylase n=1 Tax=Aureimonas jatrophae TaxID=1166073 RepID=A0A1H0IPS6_9HYPH|nr:dipeptidase [Aureimonas jatrophae]MBB3952291.1 acetylornithine deacetylase/succinyl-diaminopimelate desuccinylase-like protein [Aureimonas jatrophae]SDO33388.1 Acetylornithine deacetylase/Succinyl-diaminopimelate desuccinylase [Aureimonas jatrophae]
MADLDSVLSCLDLNLDRSVERLQALLRIPSISTDPAYAEDCQRAAEWLRGDLEAIGFDARVHETTGRPMVVARREGPAGSPNVLFYGHYDVQPVDPLELWDADPFDPRVVDGPDGSRRITGRGSADDKGQLMTFIEACRAFIAETGGLPCSVTIFLEGEEESGSPSLLPFLDTHRDTLSADVALICDTSMWDKDTPAISTGLRGLVGEEVTIHAASMDLHSGYFGGAAANPITVLARIIGELHDAEGRVILPGFYDGVPELPEDVRRVWDELPFSQDAFLGQVGLSVPFGETGRSVLEQTWSRPTAEVNGIEGGYTGKGFKTVIAAEAHAKISFRLVFDQDPAAIRESFRQFVRERLPADCRAEFHEHGGSPAIQLPFDSPVLETAREALSAEWPNKAVMIGMGGSIPVVGEFKRRLGMPSLLVGFGLADDRIHSPNEKYEMRSFAKGQRSWARILAALGERGTK